MEKVVKLMTQVKPCLCHKPVKYNNPKIFWACEEHTVLHEKILHKQKGKRKRFVWFPSEAFATISSCLL